MRNTSKGTVNYPVAGKVGRHSKTVDWWSEQLMHPPAYQCMYNVLPRF